MNRTFLLFFVLLAHENSVVAHNQGVHQGKRDPVSVRIQPKQKEILIFMIDGGGGHKTAANAIKSYLEPAYKITIVSLIKDVLISHDPIRVLTFNSYAGDDLYNYLITRNLVWLTNRLSAVGAWAIGWKRESLAQTLDEYLATKKFDMIISVIPFFNAALLDAAKKHDIPLLMVPTDLDAHTFVMGLEAPEYEKFHYFMSFEDDVIREKIAFADLPEEKITVAGFPVRPAFFEKKDTEKIKEEFSFPKDKPIVMVLMGAAGSTACFKYVRRLAKGKEPIHIVACIGRNEGIRSKIENITLPKHITVSIIGFTEKISDLMAAADVLITKPGSCSFCEALYMNVPLLLDDTYGELEVEAFNLEFTKKYQIGDVVTRFKDVNALVAKYINDDEYRETIRHNLASLEKGNFAANLQKTVQHMIEL
jgi:processive 1,2-diacylglycerol beta-glucosyltransferase